MKCRRYFAQIALTGLLSTVATASSAFETGQRWSCVTDQGAAAFLAVIDVKKDTVTFSWGAIDPENDQLTSLCEQRDELSLKEIKSFCRLLDDDASEGHVRLNNACSNK